MNKQREKSGSVKRSLFLRLWLRSLTVKRPQAALALGAILVGAALAAALLNLHRGVARKMTQEFRAYGANVLVSPRSAASGGAEPQLIGGDVLAGLNEWRDRTPGGVLAPLLHVVMRLRPARIDQRLPEFQNVVVVGTDFQALHTLYPNWRIADVGARHGVPVHDAEPTGAGAQESDGGVQHAAPLPAATGMQISGERARHGVPLQEGDCVVGTRVASTLRLAAGSEISVEPAEAAAITGGAHRDARLQCRISGILSTGAVEDDQVFIALAELQGATGLEGKLSLVELMVPGEAAQVERTVVNLARGLPSADVRPVRAIVESQGRVLGTIRWLLVSLTALIVVIVALCVMATMIAIVLERRKDVAMMKALGATDRLIMRLFLCEGAGLGLAGGVAGFGLGLLIARELGRSLFGVPLEPTWWTLPLIGLGSILVAVVATAFPVRMARAVQPATALKGV